MLIPNGRDAKRSPVTKVKRNAHSKWRGCEMLNQYGGDAKCSTNMEATQNARAIWRCKMPTLTGGDTKCSFTPYGGDAKCSTMRGLEVVQNVHPKRR